VPCWVLREQAHTVCGVLSLGLCLLRQTVPGLGVGVVGVGRLVVC
jgi:hypothetical protein